MTQTLFWLFYGYLHPHPKKVRNRLEIEVSGCGHVGSLFTNEGGGAGGERGGGKAWLVTYTHTAALLMTALIETAGNVEMAGLMVVFS